ncbi:UNVERIFIED_CONTAM: hypothetical protein Sindi_0089800 [Sesamum indicum]
MSNSHSGIFIGNIPLHASSDNCLDDDKIARAFNNSSRKTLSYIAPTKQNGEIVVRPSLDIVRDGSKRWKSMAVGYFLGKRPYYHHLKEFAHLVWPALPARGGEDDRSGPSPPVEIAIFPPAEGSPRVVLGVDGLSTAKGGSVGAEIATADLGFGGDATLKGVHGGSFSSSFNLDEFLNLVNHVIDKGNEASMAALNDFKIRWQVHFGEGTNLRETTTVERGRERPVTGGLRKALRCLVPLDAGQTVLPAMVTVRVPRWRLVEMEVFLVVRPILVFDEWPVTSPATGDMCQKADVDAYVDTAGAEVAAKVGDKDGELENERAAGRADVIPDARADVIPDARADVIPDARADVIHDARTDVTAYTAADVINPRADISSYMEEKTATWVKNWHPSNGIVNDKIADAFNNSSWKTLSFIAPTTQNGEVVVCPSLDTVRDGSKRWKATAVGYFMGKRSYYHHLKEFAHSVWPTLREVTATANGFFFFQFKTKLDMEEVIKGGPWLFQGQPIVLQKWKPGMAMRKLKHTQVPIWIKLRHLPLEFWTTEGLSTVASGVGKPLYPDVTTRACTRLDSLVYA